MSARTTACICVCLLWACKSQPPAAATDSAAQAKFQAAETKPLVAEVDTAENVLRRYYSALAARDFRTAYALWSDRGEASHQSFEAFQAGFSATRTTSVDIDKPGDVEGAAGSLYVSIPVSVHAQLNDGTRQEFTGTYVLRRINDVEGSTQEQRRWHIYSAALRALK